MNHIKTRTRKNGLLNVAVLVLLCCIFTAPPAAAWGLKGHRLVGILADGHLSPEVQKLCREDFNITSLAEVSTWADQVKRERSQGRWHYLNIAPFRLNYIRQRDCPDGECVVKKIIDFSHVLKDPTQSRARRKEALMYLVHFVADVHQPLHLGNRKDRGGNEMTVRVEGAATDLHALWDEGLIPANEKDLLQYARRLNEAVRPEDIARWSRSTVIGWAHESRALALDHAYVLKTDPAGTLSPAYIAKSRRIVELRLRQAGVRLAARLNALLK